MFTGIVEEIGTVKVLLKGAKSAELTINANIIFDDLKLGDSVAVNGVCLTITRLTRESLTADVMNETLRRSSLGTLNVGSRVNLERAMPANGRFGGHIVTGHIDGTGVIAKKQTDEIAVWYTIRASDSLMRYIIEKGSIAVDGISLTVASVSKDCFAVSVIPHTAKETILSEKNVGNVVNLENDIVGKYIEKLKPQNQKITRDFLTINGF